MSAPPRTREQGGFALHSPATNPTIRAKHPHAGRSHPTPHKAESLPPQAVQPPPKPPHDTSGRSESWDQQSKPSQPPSSDSPAHAPAYPSSCRPVKESRSP